MKTIRQFGRPVLLASVAAIAAMPATAFAQDAGVAAEDEVAADEIIVTATKREQTLQDVPVAVSVTNAETIERAQIRDLIDLQTVVPSLRVGQLQSSANTNFFIRGFGNGANNPGIEPSVGVFVDGVYRSRSAAQITDLPNISRVEVLRGPQSTLFGKNASAGIISLVTREPQFELGGSVELSYGNFDAIVAKADITGPLSDTIAVSLAGGLNKRDGYFTDLGYNGKSNERDRWFVRGQALFEPNDSFKVRLIADYDKIDEVCCGVVNLINGPTGAVIVSPALGGRINAGNPFGDVAFTNFPSTNDIENYGFSGQMDYEFGPLSLTSITAYRQVKALTNADSDFTSADLIGSNSGDVGIKTFTQELRLASDYDGPLNFLLGGYYFNEKVRNNNALTFGTDFRAYADALTSGGIAQVESQILNVPVGTFQRAGNGVFETFRLKNTAYSIFGNIDFEITDSLTLTLGGNYTKDKKRATGSAVSTDAFSALDLVTVGNGVLRSQAIATSVGQALGLNRLATAAEVTAFATGTSPAGAAGAAAYANLIVPGATAFANANAVVTPQQAAADNNAATTTGNPILPLRAVQFLPPFQAFPNAVESGRVSDGDFSYTVRLAYEINNALNVYASYATGYKGASFNLTRDSRPLASDIAAIRTAGIAVPNLTSGTRFALPEESTVYELGIKANWGLAGFNAAVFKQQVKNFQSNIFTGTGFGLANADKQSTFGIEFEGYVKPTEALTLNLAMTYLDPKYDRFTNSTVGDITTSTSGVIPAGIPPIAATFGATYEHEFGNGDELILRGDYHYESNVQITEGLPAFLVKDAFGNITSNAAALSIGRQFNREVKNISASITYVMDMGLEFTLWGRNIANSRYITTIFDAVAQQGSVSGYPNQPRTYGVTARYKF